jgi:hypothetical protein
MATRQRAGHLHAAYVRDQADLGDEDVVAAMGREPYRGHDYKAATAVHVDKPETFENAPFAAKFKERC